MSKKEQTLNKTISDLLETASDVFSNHICNDFSMPYDEEHAIFYRMMMYGEKEQNEIEDDLKEFKENGQIDTADWLVLSYLARLFADGKIEIKN